MADIKIKIGERSQLERFDEVIYHWEAGKIQLEVNNMADIKTKIVERSQHKRFDVIIYHWKAAKYNLR